MVIGFDAKRVFSNRTGLGNYSRTLIDNLSKYSPFEEFKLFTPEIPANEYGHYAKKYPTISSRYLPSSYWRSFGVTQNKEFKKLDLYHGLSNELPILTRNFKGKKIVTIHDLFYLKFPKDFKKVDRIIYKIKTEKACRVADVIVAISESTKRDLIDILDINPQKIVVIYQSCNEIYQQNTVSITPQGLPQDYALFVGSLNERKNVKGLLNALGMIPQDQRIPMIIVGQGGKRIMQELYDIVKEEGLHKIVTFKGSLSAEELKLLYQRAKFTCLPSFYEGFGIPVIESLFCNTPVLVSNVSSLPEASGPCGLTFNVNDLNELSMKLHLLTEDGSLRNTLKSKIPEHISKFSSRITAMEMSELYNKLK